MLQIGTRFLINFENAVDSVPYIVVAAFKNGGSNDCLAIENDGAINADPGCMMVLESTGEEGEYWLDGSTGMLTYSPVGIEPILQF